MLSFLGSRIKICNTPDNTSTSVSKFRYSLLAFRYSIFDIAPGLSPDIASTSTSTSLFRIRHSLFAIPFWIQDRTVSRHNFYFYFHFYFYFYFLVRYSLFVIRYSSRIGSLRSPIRRWRAVNPFKACAALDFFVLYAPLKRAWLINKNVKWKRSPVAELSYMVER